MIVADSSALLAIVFAEPDATTFVNALLTDTVVLCAGNRLEAHIATSVRLGVPGVRELNALIGETVDEVVGFDSEHTTAALRAWDRFGKGRHPAKLNFGDCMAYATAKLAGAPLLFKGDDFGQTDVTSAL